MFKYVELCVELRRGRFAKDGLIQYRIICQQVNVSSLEEVIKQFMQLSTEKAEQAASCCSSQAQALEEALDVDDLEADKRPEDLMLGFVSGEKGKDRSDRELVTPWFKFLWETYRTVLEVLRNNSKLEALYAMTAYRAFQFCKQYKRTAEFRRLCEIIRNHLANLNKYKDQRDRPDLSEPESLQLYLDTRFEQLKIATELELWQEAFRSVEDIHGLMSMVKKTPKPSLMVVYYAKLSEIFWISSSHLYHAYAWLKLFNLQKSFNKNLSQKDLQLIASSVILAALSVAPYDQRRGASYLELEIEKERNLRMAKLIGFNLDPKFEGGEVLSRASLLSELVAKGVLSCAAQEVKDLFKLLEHDFLPLDLALKVQPLLTKISKVGGKLSSASSVPEVQLSQFVPALEKLATLRLLQQVSQVYQTMKIECLSAVIPFYNFAAVEKISADALKHNFVAMKVDHMKGVVLFGNLERIEESNRLENQKKTEEAEKKRLADVLEQKKIQERRLEKEQELQEKPPQDARRKDKTITEEEVMELAQRLVEERVLHEREQQCKIELSQQQHEGDLKEKNRLSRMLDYKMIFQGRVESHRQAEFDRRRVEQEQQISRMIRARKQERAALRKKIFFLRSEEERQRKLIEEEEAERCKKEEAERKAKLDEIAEKQRQRDREVEEKDLLAKAAQLEGSTDGAAAPAAAPQSSGKYVPRFRKSLLQKLVITGVAGMVVVVIAHRSSRVIGGVVVMTEGLPTELLAENPLGPHLGTYPNVDHLELWLFCLKDHAFAPPMKKTEFL
ncbi:Proteasome component (PCI) domain containing protein [Trema orientale]|uniref:Eukaryotic translation initiation factor 3 large subunit n=1 Tax=Trema orientale TaxID=63057 RepID=A0A2P5CWV1_TREOI|nr:Proteasome component (PCI) domain containing protein [Trema orientale]